ncbi:hypothetical protein [Streptomyces sp. UG1]|uniref:hypothetical protein n=1 Tax=Streptomyces sp. UG1 TaxID=3417652 RepID=UPI003CF90559
MRKAAAALAALGLAVLGVSATATTAHAGPICNSKWPDSRDGMVRAWDGFDCQGTYLGGTQGSDPFWGDSSGAFRGSDNNRASSVMNSGYIGDLDIVAFYRLSNYGGGYACLAPGEYYADNLSDNSFTGDYPANNNISSHRWVNGCSNLLT